jgi:ligand-binding SRPBCC domain-containing protein
MIYRHSFEVAAPQSAVADFHRKSDSMGAITPPPVIVRVHSAPEQLSEGDEMAFTMWLGPLPIHWVARIEQTTPVSFVDRQLSGPFASWRHLHTYVAHDSEKTLVIDQVEAELSNHWWWKVVGMGMWVNLSILFAYRGWKTRRLLARHKQAAAVAA